MLPRGSAAKETPGAFGSVCSEQAASVSHRVKRGRTAQLIPRTSERERGWLPPAPPKFLRPSLSVAMESDGDTETSIRHIFVTLAALHAHLSALNEENEGFLDWRCACNKTKRNEH